MTTSPKGATLLFLGLGTLTLLLYWRVLAYPFIHDDWYWLLAFRRAASSGTGLAFVRTLFSPDGQLFFRPLGQLYFFALYLWTGVNPVPFHILALLIHTTSAFVLTLLVWELLEDRLIAVAAGMLYVGATSVHLDSLLWAVGIYELGAALFFLLALWLFVKEQPIPSAIAFALALLFKGSAIVLPAVVLCISVSRSGGRPRLNRIPSAVLTLWPHLIVTAVFFVLKARGVSPFSFPADHPYTIDLWGLHLLRNAYRYLAWIFQSILPFSLPFHKMVNAGLFLLSLGGLVALGARLTRRPMKENENTPDSTTLPIWLMWCLAGVVPLLFLPNHAFRYYLTIPLPAFLVLFLLALDAAVKRMVHGGRLRNRTLAAAVGTCLLLSTFHIYRVDQEGIGQQRLIDGTDALVMRGSTVESVYRGLIGAAISLPAQAVVVFKDVDLWALGKDSALRFWYDDSSIRVYDFEDLRMDGNGLYLDSPVENQLEFFTGAKEGKVYLDTSRTFVYGLENGVLQAIDWRDNSGLPNDKGTQQ